MGTELFRAGVPRDACLEELNLTQPEVVQRIHRAYVDAGAEILVTNTFQANPERFGKARFFSVGEAAIDLARDIAGPGRFLLLDASPFGQHWSRYAAACYVTLAIRRDIDGILMETCSTVTDTDHILKSARHKLSGNARRLPVLISWTFRRTSHGILATEVGNSPEGCARAATHVGVAALGVNCGRDIEVADILEIVRRYRSVTDLPLFVRPNAGTPKQIDGQWVYPETPEGMAAWLPELFKAGVVMVGGCCGTTPAHIAAFRKVVDEWNRTHDFSSQ